MRFFLKTLNAIARLREHGFRQTVKYARERANESYHEWRLGIRTMGRLAPQELGIDSPFAFEYYPADYQTIYQSLRMLPIREGLDGFLDLGCGMGRAVAVAATFPFRRVVGVELSPRLAEVARANVQRAQPKLRCADVSIITADAQTYMVPDDINFIFFYNPFQGPVLSAALHNIRASLTASPRGLTIVFKNTQHVEPMMEQFPWLIKQREFRASDADHKVMLLEARV